MSNTHKLGIGILALAALLLLWLYVVQGNPDTRGTDVSDESISREAAAIDQELQLLEEDRAAIEAELSETASY